MNNSEVIVRLADNLVLRNDLVCFNKQSGEVITLNHTGYLLLKLSSKNRSIHIISSCLAELYGKHFDEVFSDASAFYQEMSRSGIVKLGMQNEKS